MFGVFVVYTGYPVAFALTGTLMLAALVPAVRDRTAERHAPPEGTRLPAQVPSAGVGSGSGQRLEGVEQRDAAASS
jgi:hypothetical protein